MKKPHWISSSSFQMHVFFTAFSY